MIEHPGPWPPDDVELSLNDASDIGLDAEEIHDRRGNRIDQAYVDAAVEHVHRTVGRPSLTRGHRSFPRGDQDRGSRYAEFRSDVDAAINQDTLLGDTR